MTRRHGDPLPDDMVAQVVQSLLSGEKRQVWALRRDTGALVYIDEGQSGILKDFAESHLKCLHPDCTDKISTRAGTKRDAFYHSDGVSHATGPETEAHLAGKAMIERWLREQLEVGEPPHPVVRPEQTLKDPAARLNRRPDVLVTGRSGQRLAFEVEYKSWDTGAWRSKQADFDRNGIRCLWLLGHTRVRSLTTSPGSDSVAVRVPRLATEIARAGKPLLVINPITKQVGTLANDQRFTRWYNGWSTSAWLRIDDLSECQFSTHHGITTPAVDAISAARRAEEEEAERVKRVGDEMREGRRRFEEAAAKARAARHAEEVAAPPRGSASRDDWWEASPLRARVVARFRGIPPEFGPASSSSPLEGAIHAAPQHWRAAIYMDLIERQSEPFGINQVFKTLMAYGIGWDPVNPFAFNLLRGWLSEICRRGLLSEHNDMYGRRWYPTGMTIQEAWVAPNRDGDARE